MLVPATSDMKSHLYSTIACFSCLNVQKKYTSALYPRCTAACICGHHTSCVLGPPDSSINVADQLPRILLRYLTGVCCSMFSFPKRARLAEVSKIVKGRRVFDGNGLAWIASGFSLGPITVEFLFLLEI